MLDDPHQFAIYELYTDADAITAHKASHHFAEWLEDIDGLMVWKKAGKYNVTGVDNRPVPEA